MWLHWYVVVGACVSVAGAFFFFYLVFLRAHTPRLVGCRMEGATRQDSPSACLVQKQLRETTRATWKRNVWLLHALRELVVQRFIRLV